MATYLYGLLLGRNAARLPRGVRGIGGSEVRPLATGALAALVATVEGLPERVSLEDVRAHDAVLRAAVDAGVTVAAARFRQVFDDDASAQNDVEARAGRVVRLLEDLDGLVEMRVLVSEVEDLPKTEPVAMPGHTRDAGPGTAYLEHLRDLADTARPVSLRAALGPVVRAERVTALPRDAGVAFAHLVKRDDIDEYRERVTALPALSGASVVGPLALYSFAEPDDDGR